MQIQSWTKRRKRCGGSLEDGMRYFATDKASSSELRKQLVREHVKDLSSKQKAKKEAKALDKVEHSTMAIRSTSDLC
jgi:amino-acid N-acetyltransferase